MKNSILVIEDGAEMRDNTAELLQLAGYRVFTAHNGKDGLVQARENKPDLILCDVMMPELDGYGVLRAIENIPELRGTPFVFFTAMSEKEDFRKAMDLGADDYLTKPFTGDELLRVVAARLRKSNMESKESASSDVFYMTEDEAISLEEIIDRSTQKTTKKFRDKDVIYMEGDSAVSLFFVHSGKVKTYKTNEWGKEYITGIFGEGDFFGHISLLKGNQYRQSAMAIEDAEVSQVPRQEFFNLLQSNNELSLKMIRLLADSNTEYEERLLKLAYDSARKKVAEALLFIFRQYEDEKNVDIMLPVNRENLSAIAGIAPESVSRNLTDFREENLIATDKGGIRILDYNRLKKMKG